MITKSKAFLTSDGKIFSTIEEAQFGELSILLDVAPEDNPINNCVRSTINNLLKNKEAVLAILSTRKPRTPKVKPARVVKLPKTIQHSETGS